MIIGSAHSSYGYAFLHLEALLPPADILGFGRQSFADPLFPKKLLGGDEESIRWCKCCEKNNCSTLLRGHKEAGCVVFEDYYRRQLKELKPDGRQSEPRA
jgi:hypothetical protein